MGIRRQAREATLQMLYLCDTCRFTPEEVIETFLTSMELPKGGHEFAYQLVSGTWKQVAELDCLIGKYAENWEMARMAVVDRNILRLATFEMLSTPDTPISVIIDEAVEIAKKFSTNDSGKFVNGILDKMKAVRKAKP